MTYRASAKPASPPPLPPELGAELVKAAAWREAVGSVAQATFTVVGVIGIIAGVVAVLVALSRHDADLRRECLNRGGRIAEVHGTRVAWHARQLNAVDAEEGWKS